MWSLGVLLNPGVPGVVVRVRGCSFVYDLPPEFNTALLADELPRVFSCRTSMYAAEVVIHELLLNRSVGHSYDISPAMHMRVCGCVRSKRNHNAHGTESVLISLAFERLAGTFDVPARTAPWTPRRPIYSMYRCTHRATDRCLPAAAS